MRRVLVDIPENVYNRLKSNEKNARGFERRILEGKIVPDKLTNGQVCQILLGSTVVAQHDSLLVARLGNQDCLFKLDWWDAPCQGEVIDAICKSN